MGIVPHQIGYSSVKYGLKKIYFFRFYYILKSHSRELHKQLRSSNLKVIAIKKQLLSSNLSYLYHC